MMQPEQNDCMNRLQQQIDFILELDKLKQVMRQSYLLDTSRKENDAEHSWHLAVMALVLYEYAAEPNTDIRRVIEMILVHDIVEIDAGDTFLYDQIGYEDKTEREQVAADHVFGLLPTDQNVYLRRLWEEFEEGQTPEARFARTLDRVEPLLLNYYTQGRMWCENKVTQENVLDRCTNTLTQGSPVLAEYMLQLIYDAHTRGYFANNNLLGDGVERTLPGRE